MSRRITTSRSLLVPVFLVALLVGISPVPAGRGHLGSPTTLTGSKVEVTIGPYIFTHTITPGETNTAVNADLVARMNDPNVPFNAAVVTDPSDPNAVIFEVLTAQNQEVPELRICETSASLKTLGAIMPMGSDVAVIDPVTTVNADGTYRVSLRHLETGVVNTFFYLTTAPPNNTPTGLNASLIADLRAAGYIVVDGSGFISIRRSSGQFSYVKIDATDTGIVSTCTKMEPSINVVPALSQYGFFVLVLLMTVTAVLMLRRNSPESGAPSRS